MKPSILDVKGIGLSTVDILAQHGIKTIEDLAEAGFDRLISIPGFSGVRASRIIQEANLLSENSDSTENEEIVTLYKPKKAKNPKGKTKGKDKKKDKGKKKDKAKKKEVKTKAKTKNKKNKKNQ